MNETNRARNLKFSLTAFGIVFLCIYPLGYVWPPGFVWHGGEGAYYLQMISGVYGVLGAFLIAAAKSPDENRSLILFTIVSSLVHALIMAVQAIMDHHETAHLIGDVPALLLVTFVLWFLLPPKQANE